MNEITRKINWTTEKYTEGDRLWMIEGKIVVEIWGQGKTLSCAAELAERIARTVNNAVSKIGNDSSIIKMKKGEYSGSANVCEYEPEEIK